MPRTVKEIVEFKLKCLRGKVHSAQQCVDKLHDSLESLPLDFNSVNMVLDNMVLSVDEFVANFDEIYARLDESSQTEKKFSKGATPHVTCSQISSKDTEIADLVSRMNKLEVAMDEMRSTIHGGGDGEGSPHRGILSHLSVLENSFNEGTQKLSSMEEKVQDFDTMKQKVQDVYAMKQKVQDIDTMKQKVQDIDTMKQRIQDFDVMKQRVQDISIFRNEMRAKTVKEDQQKEMDNISLNKRIQSLEFENVTLTEEFKEVKEKMKEAIIENNSYEQRLICVEDAVKSVKEVSVASKDQVQNVSVKRFEKLESKVHNVVSDTDSCKKQLTNVEKQLKSVKPVSGADMDSLNKAQILQRISVLENRPSVAFRVWLKHSGPWRNRTVIRDVEEVDFNVGNAFQKDQCRFIAPVDGIYCMSLYLTAVGDFHKSKVYLMTCDITESEWNDEFCDVTAEEQINGGANCDVALVDLRKGEAVRAKVGSGDAFGFCVICGWLVTATK